MHCVGLIVVGPIMMPCEYPLKTGGCCKIDDFDDRWT